MFVLFVNLSKNRKHLNIDNNYNIENKIHVQTF